VRRYCRGWRIVEPVSDSYQAPIPQSLPPIDLDKIEADLAGVEAALERLESGTYWSDEVTGQEIPSDLLAEDPTRRRA